MLRLWVGELVMVSDGRGWWWWVRVGGVFEFVGEVLMEFVVVLVLIIGFVVLKGEWNELVV